MKGKNVKLSYGAMKLNSVQAVKYIFPVVLSQQS